jgi:hypothetical protein
MVETPLVRSDFSDGTDSEHEDSPVESPLPERKRAVKSFFSAPRGAGVDLQQQIDSSRQRSDPCALAIRQEALISLCGCAEAAKNLGEKHLDFYVKNTAVFKDTDAKVKETLADATDDYSVSDDIFSSLRQYAATFASLCHNHDKPGSARSATLTHMRNLDISSRAAIGNLHKITGIQIEVPEYSGNHPVYDAMMGVHLVAPFSPFVSSETPYEFPSELVPKYCLVSCQATRTVVTRRLFMIPAVAWAQCVTFSPKCCKMHSTCMHAYQGIYSPFCRRCTTVHSGCTACRVGFNTGLREISTPKPVPTALVAATEKLTSVGRNVVETVSYIWEKATTAKIGKYNATSVAALTLAGTAAVAGAVYGGLSLAPKSAPSAVSAPLLEVGNKRPSKTKGHRARSIVTLDWYGMNVAVRRNDEGVWTFDAKDDKGEWRTITFDDDQIRKFFKSGEHSIVMQSEADDFSVTYKDQDTLNRESEEFAAKVQDELDDAMGAGKHTGSRLRGRSESKQVRFLGKSGSFSAPDFEAVNRGGEWLPVGARLEAHTGAISLSIDSLTRVCVVHASSDQKTYTQVGLGCYVNSMFVTCNHCCRERYLMVTTSNAGNTWFVDTNICGSVVVEEDIFVIPRPSKIMCKSFSAGEVEVGSDICVVSPSTGGTHVLANQVSFGKYTAKDDPTVFSDLRTVLSVSLHSASTVPGTSGSPIIAICDGQLTCLGVHVGGHREERVNYWKKFGSEFYALLRAGKQDPPSKLLSAPKKEIVAQITPAIKEGKSEALTVIGCQTCGYKGRGSFIPHGTRRCTAWACHKAGKSLCKGHFLHDIPLNPQRPIVPGQPGSTSTSAPKA